tara:strand:- start:2439 stop:3509 length:1071 start_codon:yes stop_codon:yes gene_type:complete
MDIFFITILVCLFFWTVNKFTTLGILDNVRKSPQTFHKKSVSRLGGVAILTSLAIGAFYLWADMVEYKMLRLALISCLPIFLIGLVDDLKLQIPPILRILLMIPTPIMFFYLLDLKVFELKIFFIDYLLTFEFFSLLFLIFAIVGMANAFNIIDGFNGLLTSYCLLLMLNIYFNLDKSVDIQLVFFITTLFFAVLGIFVVNFPFGKIFLGDGGAYLLGGLIPLVIIKYFQQLSLSPWYVLVLFIYPTVEVLISVIRKVFIRKRSALQPDGLHMHMLVYKRLTKILGFRRLRLRHFGVTAFIILLNFPFILLANRFKYDDGGLMLLSVLFLIVYVSIYLSLIPKRIFRSPILKGSIK